MPAPWVGHEEGYNIIRKISPAIRITLRYLLSICVGFVFFVVAGEIGLPYLLSVGFGGAVAAVFTIGQGWITGGLVGGAAELASWIIFISQRDTIPLDSIAKAVLAGSLGGIFVMAIDLVSRRIGKDQPTNG